MVRPGQYETGTPASALYLGLGAGLDFLGWHRRAAGHRHGGGTKSGIAARTLRRHSRRAGHRITPRRNPDGIVAFAVEGMEGNEVSDALRNRWQIAQRATNINEPSGVRISVAFYTSNSELDTLVEAVTILAGENGNR